MVTAIHTSIQTGASRMVEAIRPISTELTKLTTLVGGLGEAFAKMQPQTASLQQVSNLLKQISENAAKAKENVKGMDVSDLTRGLSQTKFIEYHNPAGRYQYVRQFAGVNTAGEPSQLSVTYNKDDQALRARMSSGPGGSGGRPIAIGPEAEGLVSDELRRSYNASYIKGEMERQKALYAQLEPAIKAEAAAREAMAKTVEQNAARENAEQRAAQLQGQGYRLRSSSYGPEGLSSQSFGRRAGLLGNAETASLNYGTGELTRSIQEGTSAASQLSHPLQLAHDWLGKLEQKARSFGRLMIYVSASMYSLERIGRGMETVFAGPIEKVIEATTDQRKFQLSISGLLGGSNAAAIDRGLISGLNATPFSLEESRRMVQDMTKVAPMALSMLGGNPSAAIQQYQGTIGALQAMNPQTSSEEILRGIEGALLGQGRALRTVVQIDPQQLAQLVGRSGQSAFRADPAALLEALNKYVGIFGPPGGAAALTNMPGVQWQHIKDQLSGALSNVGETGVFDSVVQQMRATADALAQYFTTDAAWVQHAQSIGNSMKMIVESMGQSLLGFMDHAMGIDQHKSGVEGAAQAVDAYFQRLASLGPLLQTAAVALGTAVRGIGWALDQLVHMVGTSAGNIAELQARFAEPKIAGALVRPDITPQYIQAFSGAMGPLMGKTPQEVQTILERASSNKDEMNGKFGSPVNLVTPEQEFVYQAYKLSLNHPLSIDNTVGGSARWLPQFASNFSFTQDVRQMNQRYGMPLVPDLPTVLSSLQNAPNWLTGDIKPTTRPTTGPSTQPSPQEVSLHQSVDAEKLERLLLDSKYDSYGQKAIDYLSQSKSLRGLPDEDVAKLIARVSTGYGAQASDIQKFGGLVKPGMTPDQLSQMALTPDTTWPFGPSGRNDLAADQLRKQNDALSATLGKLDPQAQAESFQELSRRMAEVGDKIVNMRVAGDEAALTFQAFGQNLQKDLGGGIGKFFTDIETHTKNASQAFREMGRQILGTFNDLFSKLIVNNLFNALLGGPNKETASPGGIGAGLLNAVSGGSQGGLIGGLTNYIGSKIPGTDAYTSAQVAPYSVGTNTSALPGYNPAIGGDVGYVGEYAGGGVVSSPHFGIVGEGPHPEAIVPMPHGYIPVSMDGNHALLPGGGRIPIGPSGMHAGGGVFGSPRISSAGTTTPFGPNAQASASHPTIIYNVASAEEATLRGYSAIKGHILNDVFKETRPGGKLHGANRRG